MMTFRTGWLWLALCTLTLTARPAAAANVVTLSTAAGYAGDTRVITVSLANADTVSGLQFTIRDAPDNLEATAVTRAARLSAFSAPSFNDSLGVLKIVIFAFGNKLLPGSGPVFTITYNVKTTASAARTPIIFDQVVLADHRARTVSSSGVNGVFDVLPPISVAAHPAGQPVNPFTNVLSPVTKDLYRFALNIPFSSAQISRLALHPTFIGLSPGDMRQVELYRDTNGDGATDGATVAVAASVTVDSIIFSGLNLSLGSPNSEYYVVRGTVQLRQAGVQLGLSLAGNGVTGLFVTADYSEPARQYSGNVAGTIHTAGGNAVGDINGDLRLNVSDVIRVVRVIIGVAQIEGDIRAFDVDDNNRVDITDVVTLLQRILTG